MKRHTPLELYVGENYEIFLSHVYRLGGTAKSNLDVKMLPYLHSIILSNFLIIWNFFDHKETFLGHLKLTSNKNLNFAPWSEMTKFFKL